MDHLDRAGLQTAVVSLPPPFFREHLDVNAARDWVHAVQEGLLAATAASPRLRPLAYLPLGHPELAHEEFERVRGHTRFLGFSAGVGGATPSLADQRLDPLWSALAADGRMLLLHPGVSRDFRLKELYLANLFGNPTETGLAAAQLVLGGVLTRHPELRMLLVHCGGTVPAVVGRWERGVDTARPGLPLTLEPPTRTVKRFYVDCLAYDPRVVDLAVDVFGPDRLVLGSDWPFPMGTPDPSALVAHRGEDFRARAAVENALDLLRFVT